MTLTDISGIVFDMDGVLVDSEQINAEAHSRAYAQHGYALPAEDMELILGRNPHDSIKIFAQKYGIVEQTQEKILEDGAEIYRELWGKKVELMPGADKLLRRLVKEKFELALATTNSRRTVRRFLDKFDFEGVFDVILTFEDVERRKPDPGIYVKAREQLRVPADHVVVVEDSGVGVTAAKRAGLWCVAIRARRDQKDDGEDISQADFMVASLQEFEECLFD